jgi:transposase
MTKKRTRRAFDAAFKLQVVQMIRDQGLSVGQACRDMNLVESAVRRWVEQFDEEAAGRPGLWQAVDRRAATHPTARDGDPATEIGQRNPKIASAFFARELK